MSNANICGMFRCSKMVEKHCSVPYCLGSTLTHSFTINLTDDSKIFFLNNIDVLQQVA